MATASPSILSPVIIGDMFTATVSVIPEPLETITSVTGSLSGTPLEPGITITGGSNSIIISGKHQYTFTDVFTYTEPEFTDLEVTPSQVTGRGNLPQDKNLFNLNQDKRKSEIRTYNLVINGNATLTVTQEVLNPLEAMRSFMANYNYMGG